MVKSCHSVLHKAPSWPGSSLPLAPAKSQASAFCGFRHTGHFSVQATCLAFQVCAQIMFCLKHPPFLPSFYPRQQISTHFSELNFKVFSVKNTPSARPQPSPWLSEPLLCLGTCGPALLSVSAFITIHCKYVWTHLSPSPALTAP